MYPYTGATLVTYDRETATETTRASDAFLRDGHAIAANVATVPDGLPHSDVESSLPRSLHSVRRCHFADTLQDTQYTDENGAIAVSRDGSLLYVVSQHCWVVQVFRVSDGALVHTFGTLRSVYGDEPTFLSPDCIAVAPDDAIFVANTGRKRITVLSKQFELLNSFSTADGDLDRSPGRTTVSIAASDALVATLTDFPYLGDFVHVYRRSDGAVLWRRILDNCKVDDGMARLLTPKAICFMDDQRSVAVAGSGTGEGYGRHRIAVFSEHGEFVRHVQLDTHVFKPDVHLPYRDEILRRPSAIRAMACSPRGELVTLFDATLTVLDTRGKPVAQHTLDLGGDAYPLTSSVAIHDNTIAVCYATHAHSDSPRFVSYCTF